MRRCGGRCWWRGLSPSRRRRWCRRSNAQVAGFLFNSAKNGNVKAQIFWLKTWARWRETPVELQHSGSIGRKDLCEYSDAELLAIVTAGVGEISQPKVIEGGQAPRADMRRFLQLVANAEPSPKE